MLKLGDRGFWGNFSIAYMIERVTSSAIISAMQTRLQTFRVVLLIAVSLTLLVLAAIFNTHYSTVFPISHATLIVQRGTVQISHANNETEQTVLNTDNAAVNENDTLTVSADGRATLHFSDDTSVDLFPDSQLAILEVRQIDVSTQVTIKLHTGQIESHVGIQPDRRARFDVVLPFGGYVSARQADFVVLVGHKTFVGALSGTPTFNFVTGELPVPAGSGFAIGAEQLANHEHLEAKSWAWVRVPLYKPDGSAVALPITLTQDDLPESADYFTGESGDALLVPGGPYTLGITLEAQPVYIITGLTFPVGQLTEWPVTLGEIQFNFVDSSGKSLPTPALLLKTDKTTSIPPDTPILVSPKVNFTVARANVPDQTQYTGDLSIAPGQRLYVPVRADLFGTGVLEATILDVNNEPLSASAANVSINVYKSGTEDSTAPPVGTLRSDGSIGLFPPGDYVVIVAPLRNSDIAMAARYRVTVNAAQATTLPIKFGALNINYVDSSGNTLVPSVIYVAVADQLKQLNRPIEQVQTLMPLYGYNLSPGQTTITVPTGDYAVLVKDRRAPPLQIINVPPGKITTMVVTALDPTPATTAAGASVGS